ncbi:3-deoxy-manno-octulosonate cytidylyltransferase [Candidatus Fermentibacteria bacterium]|nr:3-deoxy-manno-octulosonate cytidylyltransferase [Candidatus Fermentibacteria bacterium]
MGIGELAEIDPGEVAVIIPARYGSERLPGKPLADLCGKPMVIRVLQAVEAFSPQVLAVATDDAGIEEAVESRGFEAVMTGPASSGTERVHAAWKRLGRPGRLVINLQCDEPFVDEAWLSALTSGFSGQDGMEVTTLGRPMLIDDSPDPHRVKVVVGRKGRALYFSRSPVPHGATGFVEHLGLYCFTPESLEACALSDPRSGPAELEGLEQLAWMEEEIRVTVLVDEFESWSVDTLEDLEVARRMVRGRGGEVDG